MRLVIVAGIVALLGGCSSDKAVSYLEVPEDALGTGSGSNKIMHTAVDYPRGILLNFPGYLIGVEKALSRKVTTSDWQTSPRKAGLPHVRIPSNESKTNVLADQIYEQPKAHIISHILEYSVKPGSKHALPRVSGCALYSLYTLPESETNYDCEDTKKAKKDTTEKDTTKQKEKPFAASWKALKRLNRSITDKMKGINPPTHIIVYTLGWNTPQEKAIRNMNSLGGHLIEVAADENADFRPLIIGVSWPSLWRNVSFVPNFISQPFSYPNKANDADELGMSWLGVLMHDILPKFRDEKNAENKNGPVPIIVIGHSFGARANTRAVFTGPAIHPRGKTAPENNVNQIVDLVISLQGAYSKNRYLTDPLPQFGGENYPYKHFGKQAGKVILTASIYDKGNEVAFWTDFAGTGRSWKSECGEKAVQPNKDFDCYTFSEEGEDKPEETIRNAFSSFKKKGEICDPSKEDECKILYLNADSIIRFNASGTGGGAHSDIYRAPIGVLTWEAIKKFAPGKSVPNSSN